MKGTIFSVREAMRRMPPMKTKPASTAMTMPTTSLLAPKAVAKAEEMELAWTMFPIKPRARMMKTEKRTASTLPKRPLKAAFM